MGSASFECWMLFGQYTIISIASIGFIIFVAVVVTSAHKEGNDWAFENNFEIVCETFSFLFLALFILMAATNALLFFQLRAKERSLGRVSDQ